MEELKEWTPLSGVPQGGGISPLLANMYLHPMDKEMTQSGYRMVRYADDFVILCKSREKAEAAYEEVQEWVKANGLELHPEKTHIGDCREKDEGFEFLGYRFEGGKRWVRKKSLKQLKDKIREKTSRSSGKGLSYIIADVNRTLKGWFNYFKHAHKWTFEPIDQFIRRRLRAVLRKQEKRPGMGRCYDDHRRWPNKFFAEAGLFTLKTAWLEASQS